MKAVARDLDYSGRRFTAQAKAARYDSADSEASARPTVLVVDDSPTTRRIHSIRLERQGCRVIQAASGLAALAQLHRQVPDMILLDVVMPKLDGLATCRKIKADRWTRHVPVVMLSANDRASDRQCGREAGADQYLSKPIDSPTLRQVVAEYCQPR